MAIPANIIIVFLLFVFMHQSLYFMHQSLYKVQTKVKKDSVIPLYSAIHYLLLPLLLVVAAATCCYYQLGYGRPNIHIYSCSCLLLSTHTWFLSEIEPEFNRVIFLVGESSKQEIGLEKT